MTQPTVAPPTCFQRHWKWWFTLAVLALVAAVRIRLLNMPLERDEGEYAYAGQLMLQGIPPYQLAYNMKFPGTYAAYAFIMGLFGQTPAGIHFGVMCMTTLTALMSTVEAKDDYTASHEQDVADLTQRVALRLGLSSSRACDVRHAALLHDVGKVAVPSEILLKPAPLNDEEWVVMRSHAAAGGSLVERIPAFAHLAPAVRASHERWDGGGYPDGLAGEQVPLAARIIAACDTYEAIVTDRPYRPARTPAEAAVELRRVAGTQLDARVVDALLEELAL